MRSLSFGACTGLFAYAVAQAAPVQTVHVDSVDGLYAALARIESPRHIRLVPGEYAINRTLTVPDDTTLAGAGVMRYDVLGTPIGFEPGTETILRVTETFAGDALNLGNGAVISGLVVRDLVTAGEAAVGRAGSLVVIASRSAGDVVNAKVVECEIDNSNPPGITADGPTGQAVVVMARNPGAHLDPPPHGGARLAVRLERSIARTTSGGSAIFVISFAPGTTTHLELTNNRIAGPFGVAGGVSRPDPVTGARTMIHSDHNHYGSTNRGPGLPAWVIIGASSAPHHPHPGLPGASKNSVTMRSTGDRIDGVVGIRAMAGRRIHSTSGPVSDNRVELDLQDLRIQTPASGGADLVLYGALAEPDTGLGTAFRVGDRNVLSVRIDGATGSGMRANFYEADSGAATSAPGDADNRLEIAGTRAEFTSRNTGFDPGPPESNFGGDTGMVTAPAPQLNSDAEPGR
jgi:hypothetical protein